MTSSNRIEGDDDDLTAVIAAENARQKAMREGDVPALRSLLAAGCIYIHSHGGTEDDISYLHAMEQGVFRYASVDIEVAQARRLAGDVFLLVGKAVLDLVRDGKSYVLNNVFIETWARRDGHWLMTSWQSTPFPAS